MQVRYSQYLYDFVYLIFKIERDNLRNKWYTCIQKLQYPLVTIHLLLFLTVKHKSELLIFFDYKFSILKEYNTTSTKISLRSVYIW